MSRIFFIAANVTKEPYPVYPLGMAVVSGALIQAGHTVHQYDFLAADRSVERLQREITEFDPDFLCFSMRNIDNVDSFTSHREWYLDSVRDLLAIARTHSKAPVICGGPGVSIIPEAILDYVGGDYGVQGEGEWAICRLIEALNKGESPARITDGKDHPLGPSEQASAEYVPEFVEFYEAASGIINLQTKRGCPFKCSYCTYPLLEGSTFRPRDPIKVVDDVERLQQRYGANDFFFTDSVFNDADGHYLHVVNELLRRNLKIRWGSYITPRSGDWENLALMKEAGLYAIELGTDASTNTTLKAMQKGFTFEEVIDFNELCVKLKLPVAHFIIFGGPDETMETVAEGLENIRKLRACVVFAFSGIRILPGTPLHKQAIREGVLTADEPLLKPKYYHSPTIDLDEMNRIVEADFLGDRTRIFPPEEGRNKLNIMKNFGFNGILWDTLIRFPKD